MVKYIVYDSLEDIQDIGVIEDIHICLGGDGLRIDSGITLHLHHYSSSGCLKATKVKLNRTTSLQREENLETNPIPTRLVSGV